jgi:hypothetical protein
MGFPMLRAEEDVDVNETLAEVVKSRELRLWEAFPLLLARSSRDGRFSYPEVGSRLKGAEREDLDSLVRASYALYRSLKMERVLCRQLESLRLWDRRQGRDAVERFRSGGEVRVGSHALSKERMLGHFQDYVHAEDRDLRALLARKEEFSLEFALSQVFSPRQKELFLKRLRGDRLSKTEMEYYSRRVKKKALALANEELHRLARSLR